MFRRLETISKPIERLGLSGKVIAMRCENIHDANLGFKIDDRELAAMCMPITEVKSAYQKFIQDFSPLIDEQGGLSMQSGNAEMLSLRLLMMDEYRRITLRDPHLPRELLPANWAGDQAFELCWKIYTQIYKAANAHYQNLQTNAGAVEANSKGGSLINSQDASSYEMRFLAE